MSKLVYAEPDDEITNLVDRLRSEKTEKELVFVLPAASRVMHSNLNARLLMQYSNSLGKKTSIVSPDARTQGTAIETGFDTFSSMAAFESGRALERAVAGRAENSPIAPGALAVAAADIPAATTRRRTAPPGPVPRPLVPEKRPVVAAPVVAAAASGGRRVGFLPWFLAAVGIFLIAMIVLFFVLPSATITITVAARPVSVTPAITGSTQPPADTLSVQTTLQQAQEQQQTAVTSTGQKIIPAVPATGEVTFSYKTQYCDSNGLCSNTASFKANTEVSTVDGKKFLTQQDSGPIAQGAESAPVPVTARINQGAAANVLAGAIKNITNSPGAQYFAVTNSKPTQGGQDQQTKTVVGQVDIDNTRNTVGAAVAQKARDDIKAKAGKDTVLADSETVDVSITTDHQPGDEVPSFNATLTAKAKATTVSEDKLKAILKAALVAQVIPGYHLTDDKPNLGYTLVQKDENGGAAWNGSAAGFQATTVNEADLRGKVSGKSPKQAVEYVRGHLDAQSASVSISPPFVPWVPFIGSNIRFRTQVQNTTP